MKKNIINFINILTKLSDPPVLYKIQIIGEYPGMRQKNSVLAIKVFFDDIDDVRQ